MTLTVSYPSLDCKHCCFHSRRVERDEHTSACENLLPRGNAARRVVVETALFCGLETKIASERGARETHYVMMRNVLQIPKLRLIKALKQLKRFQADRTGEIVQFAHDFRPYDGLGKQSSEYEGYPTDKVIKIPFQLFE